MSKGSKHQNGLLCLSRRAGESITLSGPATVTVARIRGGRAVLAIAADRQVLVLRSELSPEAAAELLEPTQPPPQQRSATA